MSLLTISSESSATQHVANFDFKYKNCNIVAQTFTEETDFQHILSMNLVQCDMSIESWRHENEDNTKTHDWIDLGYFGAIP